MREIPPLYEALYDEISRLNHALRHGWVKPTIYRQGKTYQIYSVFLESDVLWFEVFELIIFGPSIYIRIPYITDYYLPCSHEEEWHHLLIESHIARHWYFSWSGPKTGKFITGSLDKLL